MLNKGTEELVNLYNIVLIPSLKYGSVICLAFPSLIYFSVFTKKFFLFSYDICGVLGYMCAANLNFYYG